MTTTPETEDLTEGENTLDVTSTTTEDPTWSRPASQMIETADIATTAKCSAGTTKKKHPKLRNEIGDQGSRETTPEHIARPKNNSMVHAHYTGSETNMESSDQDTPSETADGARELA